jgi:hypothetical protein
MLYLHHWKFDAYYRVQYFYSKQMLSVPLLYETV